jgi:DMSO/TMAO reductase YedYZ molybdopterin-dependent catalytic subunit
LRSAFVTRGARALICAALTFCFPPSARGQTSANTNATLRVTGKVERPLVIRAVDLQVLPHKSFAVNDDKGAHVTYDGVPVVELLRRAGVPLGRRLRGIRMKLYVMVSATDGYHVVFALAEFDPDFTDRTVILADRRDGHALAPPEGPFRLVVTGEKRHARWVREVMTLDVEEAE